MRLLTLVAALAVSTSAFAQTPAVKSPNANNPAAPVAGANSFTEGQAKSKIEANGYTNVSDLKKDDNGVSEGAPRPPRQSAILAHGTSPTCLRPSRSQYAT